MRLLLNNKAIIFLFSLIPFLILFFTPSKYFILLTVILIILFVIIIPENIFFYSILYTITIPIYIRYQGFDIGLLNTFLIFILFFKYIIRNKGKHFFIDKKLNKTFFIILMLIFILSILTYNPIDIKNLLRSNLNYISALILAFFVVIYKLDFDKFTNILIFNLIFQGLFVVSQMLGYDFEIYKIFFPKTIYGFSTVAESIRFKSAMGDYELFAEFTGIMILILLFKNKSTKGFLKRFVVFILIGLSVLLLVLTVTRGAILSLIIAIFIYFILNRGFHEKLKFSVILFLLFSAFILIVGSSTDITHINIIDRFEDTYLVKGLPETRSTLWLHSLKLISSNLIIGYGPQRLLHSMNLPFPHSLYMFLFLHFGIIGFLIFSYISVKMLVRLYVLIIRYNWEKGLILFTLLIFFLIDQLKIEFLRNEAYTQFSIIFLTIIYYETKSFTFKTT